MIYFAVDSILSIASKFDCMHLMSLQHDDELEDDVRIMSRSLFHRPNITRGLINAKLVSLQSKVRTHMGIR